MRRLLVFTETFPRYNLNLALDLLYKEDKVINKFIGCGLKILSEDELDCDQLFEDQTETAHLSSLSYIINLPLFHIMMMTDDIFDIMTMGLWVSMDAY